LAAARRWRQRDCATLAEAWRQRCSGGAQRDGGSTVAAAGWLRRWQQRDIVTSAAAWRRRATGDNNEDDDNGGGDGAMGSGVTGYNDDDDLRY
jgi:hypothetical protein